MANPVMRKASGRERAYLHLRNVVLANPDMVGSFLSEQDLADAIGVSRTPVREALLRLASENLIRLVPNRGAQVVAPSIDEMRQILQARSMIETWAARHSMASGEQLAAALEERLEAQRCVPATAPNQDFIDRDRDFHLEIIRLAGNAALEQMYDVLQARHFTLGVRAVTRNRERRAQVLVEHGRIIEAIRKGDGAEVEAAISRHLDETFRSLSASL